MSHKNIWAPWRLQYLESGDDDAAGHAADALVIGKELAEAGSAPTTFFDEYWASPDNDERNLVVHRNERGMILLNRYPYTNGHLMVALGDGRPRLLDYEPAMQNALWELVALGVDLTERAVNPQGVNIGMNQGRAAGAGVPGHLHVHIVPRWAGDTNFMSVVGDVRVAPAALERMYELYRETLARMR